MSPEREGQDRSEKTLPRTKRVAKFSDVSKSKTVVALSMAQLVAIEYLKAHVTLQLSKHSLGVIDYGADALLKKLMRFE